MINGYKMINYSYGYFCRNNPNATKIERRLAIKRFLDYTRNNIIKEKLSDSNRINVTQPNINVKNTINKDK